VLYLKIDSLFDVRYNFVNTQGNNLSGATKLHQILGKLEYLVLSIANDKADLLMVEFRQKYGR